MVYSHIFWSGDTSLNKFTIKDIETMCGTDWVVGTPPDRMIIGMDKLGIKFVEYIHSPKPYDLLKKVIDDYNIPILRTITKGVPHWIIVSWYEVDKKTNFIKYHILDPWQGELIYNEKELDEVWGKRQYQFFEVIPPKTLVDPLTGDINLRYNPNLTDEDYYL
jgi:hypothetical protein